jgi:hypothetical protein
MVLIKKVVFAVIPAKTVGVVHPADSGRQMKYGPIPVRDEASVFDFVFPGLLEHFSHRGKYLLCF